MNPVRWIKWAMACEAKRPIDERDVMIAGSFPLAFGAVATIAQLAIVAAAFLYGSDALYYILPRLAVAQVFVCVSYALAFLCWRHHRLLLTRLKAQREQRIEEERFAAEEGSEGRWPPAPRARSLDTTTDSALQ